MKYLDTNIIGYAIEQHEKYGAVCKRIFEDVQSGAQKVCASQLVLIETIGVLKKINKILAQRGKPLLDIGQNVDALLSLPIVWLDVNLAVIRRAAGYGYAIPGADVIHVATMDIAGVSEIISADADFDKTHVKREDPLVMNG